MNLDKNFLIKKFKKIGIRKNDCLMIHGDAIVLNFIKGKNIEDKIKNLQDSIFSIIGKKGTILIPTFTYNFLKKKHTNILEDKSELGLFSEVFRKINKAKRNSHPIFSFLILGNKRNFFKSDLEDCFGKKSIFNVFHKNKGKIICIGCGFNRITFAIYLEEMAKVYYRFYKFFRGRIVNKNKKIYLNKIRYYVRNLNIKSDLSLFRLKKLLIKNKLLKTTNIGRINAELVKSHDFFIMGKKMLHKDKNALIEQGTTKNEIERNYKARWK